MRRRDLPRSLHRQAGYIGMAAFAPWMLRRRFNLASLFTSGIAQSLWLDRQDLSTMFQDSAGTTACAVGSPVGLALDKSKGAVRGAELASNGTFDSNTTGWVAGFGTVSSTFIAAGGVATLTVANAETNARYCHQLQGSFTAGNWYEVTYTVVAQTGGSKTYSVATSANGVGGTSIYSLATTATGTQRSIVRAGVGGTMYFTAGFNGGGATGDTLSIDNVSVREIPGNHATQGTAPARPDLLQDAAGRYYAGWDGVDGSMSSPTGGGATAGFFFCAAITVLGGAGTPRTIWSDTGTNTGRLVRINAANKFQFIAGNGVGFTLLETVATFAVGETHVVTAWDDGTNMNVQLDQGAVVSVARPAVSAGSAGFTVGKSNLSASEFFPGRDYGIVYRGSAPTATEIACTQRFLAARAGVTL